MPRDWRDDQAYAYFDTLGLPELAWECLRRNEAYRADFAQTLIGRGSVARWGLRFPGRS